MGHYRQCYYGTVVYWGFKLNDYDKCITNKLINGKQCTIIWHVNELKISHVEKIVVEHIINKLNKKFGEYCPLNLSRGKRLEYLGMTLDYTTKGKVMLSMYEYMDKMVTAIRHEQHVQNNSRRAFVQH